MIIKTVIVEDEEQFYPEKELFNAILFKSFCNGYIQKTTIFH